MNTDLDAVDLFAGLGGFSEGARLARCRVVWAANHWPVAVEAHKRNHPHAIHLCQDLHQAKWREVPRHDLMLASPQCTGHSRSRGTNKPHHETDRATAWAVVAAAEVQRPSAIVVENVPEFLQWELYEQWDASMRKLGYAGSVNILDAADFGVPQNRVRVFLVFTRSKNPVSLSFEKHPHVPISTVIDFEAGDWSPIYRPGRSPKTIERVMAGRRALGRRFLLAYYGATKSGRSLDRPIGTLTTVDRYGVIDGGRMRMLRVQEALVATGFSSNYWLPGVHREDMRLIGNSVSPVVGAAVINALKKAA